MASKGNQAFSALQVQVLNELGIDLWLSRADESFEQSLSALDQPETDFVPEPLPIAPKAPKTIVPSEEAAESIEYNLTCMRNSQLLVVAQTNDESDEALLGSLLRVSAPGNEGHKFAFSWPQPNSSPGLDAARRAFLAFTSVQASKVETPVLVIFGNDISVLLSDALSVSTDEAGSALSSFNWNGFKCVLLPDVDSLRMHWQIKRDLCVYLTKLVPTLFSLRDRAGQPKLA